MPPRGDPKPCKGLADDQKLCGELLKRIRNCPSQGPCKCDNARFGGGCQCALDVTDSSKLLLDPWDVATGGGASSAGQQGASGSASGTLLAVAAPAPAQNAATREARERLWRYVFVSVPHESGTNRRANAERTHEAGVALGRQRWGWAAALTRRARTRPRKTPSGRWKQQGYSRLTSPPEFVGCERLCFKFQPNADHARGTWELREYWKPPPNGAAAAEQLVLCCLRRTDGASAVELRPCAARLKTDAWVCLRHTAMRRAQRMRLRQAHHQSRRRETPLPPRAGTRAMSLLVSRCP